MPCGYGTYVDTLEIPLPKLVREIVPVGPTEFVELHGVGKGGVEDPADDDTPPEIVELCCGPVPVGPNVEVEL